MVGVDPALVLCYRDEYKLTLGEERGDFQVLLANEWLANALQPQPVAAVSGEPWYFFGHCTEVTALPGAPAQWATIFARFGAKLENVSVGCCGMAGTYGHEAKIIKIRSGSMSYPGIRRCSDCRVIAAWQPDIPAEARSNGLKARGYAILCRHYWRLLNDMET